MSFFVLPQSLAAYNHPRFLTCGVIISKAVLLHVDHRSILSFSVRSRDLSSCSALILFLVHSSILSMITPLNLSYSLANSRGYISLLLALSLRLHVASQPNSADEIAGVTDFGNWLRLMGSTAQPSNVVCSGSSPSIHHLTLINHIVQPTMHLSHNVYVDVIITGAALVSTSFCSQNYHHDTPAG